MPVNVGPPSATPDQHQSGTGSNVWRLLRRDRPASPITMLTSGPHQANNGSTSGTCWVSMLSNTDPLWWAIIMLARWTDTLHQLSNTYLQSTTPANADAEQVSFRCRASALGAEPTSKQRRLSVTYLLGC